MASSAQTHATLSAARGFVRMYRATGERGYLDVAEDIFRFYPEHGMTLTYENFNWFGREDSWTEPCAVVDSFLLALELHDILQKEEYRTLASRIWYGGLIFCHRANGGAGPNSCVTEKSPYLAVSMYEAPFCCTMRYAEGLKYAAAYGESIERGKDLPRDEKGRLFRGNQLLAVDEDNAFPGAERIFFEGKTYIPLPAFAPEGTYRLRIL